MHLAQHQQMLKEATEETRPQVEVRIRAENPEAFHVLSGEHETLSQRRFQDEPCSLIPMAGFVRAYVPPPPSPTETETEAAPPSKDEKEAKANEQREGAPGKDVEVSAEVKAAAGTDSEPVSVE